MIKQAICMTCHPDTSVENTLLKLERFLRIIEPYQGRYENFNWNIHYRCKNVLPLCNKLSQSERNAKRLANEIEPKLMSIIYSQNDRVFHETLRYLQGHFPQVYIQFERLYKTQRH